jgi:transglutaminase-like putative cysteine protease
MALAVATLCTANADAATRRQPLKSKADEAAEKAAADALADDKTAPHYGPPQTIQFRVGAEVTAKNGACRGIVAMVSVPLDCPEQSVRVISEDFSPEVAEVAYRPVPGGEVKQMMISIPRLNDGVSAHAILTCEVSTRTVLPPEETAELTIPKKIPGTIRAYVNASPYIEANHQRVKALSKEVMAEVDESANDWAKIEAIYDAVLKKIDYVEGPDKGAVEALRDGQADCQGRSAVFIALCRANKIPARMVWVHGHCYPEFYLEKAEGEGHWYPCESAGTRAFGEMPLARTILQKGDNFRVPERKEKLRYASDYLTGLPVPGGGRPKVKYIREIVPGSGGPAIGVSSNAGLE